MLTWLPVEAAHRIAASATHHGIPWAAYLAAETPALSGGEVIQAVTTIFNVGVLGVVFWLILQGRLHTDGETEQLRADNARLVTERDAADRRAEEALKFSRDQLAPLLVTFNASVSSLLPILQQLARYREDDIPPRHRGRDR